MNKSNYIYLSVILLLIALMTYTCNKQLSIEKQLVKYANYKDTVMYYKSKSNKLIAYNDALEIDKNTLLKANKELKDKLNDLKIKNPASYTIVKTEFKVDTIKRYFVEKLPCDSFNRNIKIDSTFYKIDLTLSNKFLSINSISIPNKQEIVVGTKKNGFLKAKSYVVTVENTNPYINVNGIQSYTIKSKKGFFGKWYVWLGAGFITGYVVAK